MIRLHADDQTLVVEQSELLVSGSVNVYQVQFTFSDQWEGLDKTAVFQAWYRTWSVPLDGDTCPIPWEALRRSGGELRAGVYGARDGQLVLPTLWADLGRVQPGASPGEAAQPPTPGVYEQLPAAANQAKQLAQGVRADAEAGRFDGADGASGLLPVARTAAADLTLAANTCTVAEGQPASLNITLARRRKAWTPSGGSSSGRGKTSPWPTPPPPGTPFSGRPSRCGRRGRCTR